MWLIVQESALEEGSLDVFVFFVSYGGWRVEGRVCVCVGGGAR